MPSYLTQRCEDLRAKPPTDQPKCAPNQCYWLIVHIDDDILSWRCERCLHYLTVNRRPQQQGLFS